MKGFPFSRDTFVCVPYQIRLQIAPEWDRDAVTQVQCGKAAILLALLSILSICHSANAWKTQEQRGKNV